MIDFLNSREDAILLWAFLILAYVIRQDPRKVMGAFWEVGRAFFHPKLVLLYGSVLGYAALVVYAAAQLGLWHANALKATVYWFAGTAVILVANAIQHGWRRNPMFFRRVLRRIAGLTLFIEFAVNLYTFPFVIEFIAVGLAISASMMQAYLDHFPADPRVRKLVDGVLTTVGFVFLGYFAVRGVGDLLDASIGRDRVEEFLVGPALTIALIPFLYAVAWWSRREQTGFRKRYPVPPNPSKETGLEETLAEADRAA